ncbi:SDR family NAD(P)-dependent oxidoreductase [Methylocaldum szegediense]|uniref:NAD(P)-dependent dehydrogenase (Short-subunit alcohol dehydrogenase family) n=1 Tax=Methylocaldum szegediense TaxID=73780 RepID=A0ABM9I9D2_9GAMM|nr:SDR family NAD(P)-dependent oxidoreductase [Methylocaldum szegediense]CAI8972542.1 NAD(P)-dependent dehydrogenase (Short-subunit alcohol dehydrogenase family) [Methylocaldum szegediense]
MSGAMLKDRVVLVTGAGGGLGSAVSKACATEGATVILLGKTIPKLEKAYDAIVAAGGPQPAIYPLDLAGATEDDYRDLAATIEREFGALHGLVHCAAELGALGPVNDISGGLWQRLLHVNLSAPFLLTRELLPLIQKSAGSAIVFVTDSVARSGKAYWGAYGVAKIGLEGFGKILADELENYKVGVHVYSPGPMQSPLRRRAYPGENPESLPSPDIHAEQIARMLSPNETCSHAHLNSNV